MNRKNLYKTAAWQKGRKLFLAEHPLCLMCQRGGRVVPATVVDHIVPHKGDRRLFFDRTNWQPLCKRHHDSDKQRQENQDEADRARGYSSAIGDDGWPLDDRHPVHQPRP